MKLIWWTNNRSYEINKITLPYFDDKINYGKTATLITIQNIFIVKLLKRSFNFCCSQKSFFWIFLFNLYKLVGRKNNPDNYKHWKILEMLRFLPDNVKI